MGSQSEEDQSQPQPQPQPQPKSQLELPPGFRFFPTDEELVVHYLSNKVLSHALPALIIAEVDLYKFDPWQLPEKAIFGEKEWYFFTPRDRKYPNGSRPNRAAGSGYWKATGADKPITTGGGTKRVGVKKALVFYSGKAPKGCKTNWIMHEYRLADINRSKNMGTLRLDDWVLCRIYNKKSSDERISKEKKPDARKGLPANNHMESSEPSSDASSKICNAADHAAPFLQQTKSNANNNYNHYHHHHQYGEFRGQVPEVGCFQRINYAAGDSQRESEDVHDGLRLADFGFQKQENAPALGAAQSLLNFNFGVEAFHSPFLQQLDPAGLAHSSSPYQEYIDSLTAQAGCLQKSYQSDMLFL